MGIKKIKFVDKEVGLTDETYSGKQIKQMLQIPQERSIGLRTSTGLATIHDYQQVNLQDGDEIIDIPFHEYGMDKRVGYRLREECKYLSEMFEQEVISGFDPDLNRWWVLFRKFRLPKGWNKQTTRLMVTVTDLYPLSAPDGFLLDSDLRNRHGRQPNHYYGSNGRHPILTAKGFGWFCLHPRGWKGGLTFRDGDSVAKYVALIETALAKVVQ